MWSRIQDEFLLYGLVTVRRVPKHLMAQKALESSKDVPVASEDLPHEREAWKQIEDILFQEGIVVGQYYHILELFEFDIEVEGGPSASARLRPCPSQKRFSCRVHALLSYAPTCILAHPTLFYSVGK